MSKVKAKAAQHKKDEVTHIAKLVEKTPVLGLLNMENLPATQLGRLRSKLRKDATMLMSKKSILRLAIDKAAKSKKGLDQISAQLGGMPALMFTTLSPFKISALIRSAKSKAPAKPGQIAPYDLIIPAGPTPFTPGPMISELASAGLKTGVEGGKITIKQDAVVAGKGEEITKKIADLLVKFSIEPMEVGLDLVAAYEDGLVYGKDVLSVDPAEYLARVKTAAAQSLALTLEIAYPTKDNIDRMIGHAFTQAKDLALSQNILSDALLEKQIGTASLAAKAIASAGNITEAE